MERGGKQRACCQSPENTSGLYIYSLPVSVLLGFQLVAVAVLFVLQSPLNTLSGFCLLPDDAERGTILCKVLFVSGIATLSQALFGARAPLVLAPSLIFMSIGAEYLRSGLWESYSDGDLYAMGQSLRRAEYLTRALDLQGYMIINSFITSFFFGALWYFRMRLPSATIFATLISACISNTLQLLRNTTDLKFEKTVLLQLSFLLLIVLYIGQNFELPYIKVIINADKKIKLKIFKLFGVLMTFIIILCINIKYEFDYENLLERAAENHSWLTFDFIPQDFNFPVITKRGLVFLPTLLSQSLVSYCCYSLLINNKGRQLAALLLECFWNLVSPVLGVFLPISVDPTSVGLSSLTEVMNGECSVISGSLLFVMSLFLKVSALSAYAPTFFLSAIVIYLYGQLIAKVLIACQEKSDAYLKIIVISVTAGLVLSLSFNRDDNMNMYLNLLSMFLRNHVLLTFIFSILLRKAFKKRELSYRNDAIVTIV